ncbi:MAG: hypothetical protein N2Z22_06120 [Turneriella sp.]|nr:hypothetical protein [Turneriella sp.]
MLNSRAKWLLALSLCLLVSSCRKAAEPDTPHDIRYAAIFSAPSWLNPDSEIRFSEAFRSRYRNRVVLLRPVSGQAFLPQLGTRAVLFSLIRINAQREARTVAHEIERALGGQLVALLPLADSPGAQDSFSGQIFYVALERRTTAFLRLDVASRYTLLRQEAEDFAHDRNLLSYSAGSLLSDTPYHTLHILGYSGILETENNTLDGHYYRVLRRLEAADTFLAERVR